MGGIKRSVAVAVIAVTAMAVLVAPANAGKMRGVPEWARPAVTYLAGKGWIDLRSFDATAPMARADFKKLMNKAFGGGFNRSKGPVTAGEVSAALVNKLGYGSLAKSLTGVRSPDGWDPKVGARFGSEVVSRELGLRRDHPTSDENLEARADDPMIQADVAWAVWQAKTSPDEWSAEALSSFHLSNYNSTRRKVVRFAMSLVGTPYVWGGEWHGRTPGGYPYGAQAAGGMDCSGFVWFVLQKKSSSYSPPGRDYAGWSIPQRSSYDMAKAAPKKLRLGEMKPGDIAFFAPDGRKSKASSVYHAGLYLGDGWMIHSSGSRAGVSLANIGKGSWWNGELAWGRRIIKG
jgi:cell wall-associated NlpC family hydrolase